MDSNNQAREIVTFYSFKGGTGRTMALANLAVLVARLQKEILLIDWDLEAPGLHRYFSQNISITESELIEYPGLIDFFIQINKLINEYKIKTSPLTNDHILEILRSVDISKFILKSDLTGINILKAGAFTNEYPKKISQFQWELFFENTPKFFQIFCDYLKEKFDFILIDSRTGFTDTSGICTMLMPEKLCLIFTPNTQSLDGVVSLAKKALDYRMNSNDFRPLKIFPIPSRVELAEKDLREEWRKGFTKKIKAVKKMKEQSIHFSGSELKDEEVTKEIHIEGFQPVFEKIFNDCYGIANCDLTRYFDEIQIHHEPKYSYGEDLAVLKETFTDRLSLTNVYSKILEKILFEPKIYSEKIKDLNSLDKISVYLSSSNDSLDISFVNNLKNELEKTNKFIIKTALGENMKAGEDYLKVIEENIINSQVVLPIITSKYLNSKNADFELYSISRNINSQKFSLTIPIYLDDVNTLDFSSSLLNTVSGINARNWQNESIKSVVKEILYIIEGKIPNF
jgi:MinD-like ATPase involved in chromosome partitioning or flagellar assembly